MRNKMNGKGVNETNDCYAKNEMNSKYARHMNGFYAENEKETDAGE